MWEEMHFLVEILQHDPSPHNYNTKQCKPQIIPYVPAVQGKDKNKQAAKQLQQVWLFFHPVDITIIWFSWREEWWNYEKKHTKKKLKKALKTRKNALYLLGGLQKQAKVP